MSRKAEDIAGRTFGDWCVLSRAQNVEHGRSKKSAWNCRCACGHQRIVVGEALRSGRSRGCGHTCPSKRGALPNLTQERRKAKRHRVTPGDKVLTPGLFRLVNTAANPRNCRSFLRMDAFSARAEERLVEERRLAELAASVTAEHSRMERAGFVRNPDADAFASEDERWVRLLEATE